MNAECRMKNEELRKGGPEARSVVPLSQFFILHSAFCIQLLLSLLLALPTFSAPLTFPSALSRALHLRASASTFADHAEALEGLSFRTLPTVRAESGFSSAENLNLIAQNVTRFDAFTALVNVDYPLLNGGADRRHVEELKADAQILRRRALDEAEDVFRETLEAFSQLYIAERRIQLLGDGSQRATRLRERARTMLEAGQISNITAAQWEDAALAAESQMVDLELQRLEAETRVKQLIGDTSKDALEVSLELDDQPMLREIKVDQLVEADAAVASAELIENRKRLALEEAMALRKPQVLLSAFGGVASVPSTYNTDASSGTFGIYGMRVSLALPMFDAAAARRVAEARLDLEEAQRVRNVTAVATRNRFDLLWLAVAAADRRIALLTEAVDVAREREQSVSRLVTAGVRAEADLVEAANSLARRESDLLAVRVDRWKLQQRVKWGGAAVSQGSFLAKTPPGFP